MDISGLEAEEVKERLSLILILAILSIVGLVCNIHVIFVFVKKMRRSTYRVFVLTLAVIDILGCSISIPFQIVDETHPFSFTWPIACKLFRYLDTNLAIASALMLVVIAMERYRKICTPSHVQVTETKAIHMSLCVIFVSSLITSPALIVYGQQTMDIEEFNVTVSECSWDDHISNSIYGYLYYGLELLFIIFSMISITILYTMVGAAIRRHRKSVGISLAARFDPRNSNPTKIVHKTETGEEITIDRLMDSDDTKLVTFSTFTLGRKGKDVEVQQKRVSFIAVSERSSSKGPHGQDVSVNSEETTMTNGEIVKDVIEDNTMDILSLSPQNSSENRSQMTEAICPGSESEEVTSDQRADIGRLSTGVSTNSIPVKRQKNLYTIVAKYFRSKSKDLDALREQRITKLLFFITLTFVVTYSPYIIILVIYATQRDFSENLSPAGTVLYLLALRLYLINNVTNAFYYGFFDLEFRNHVKDIYKGLLKRKQHSEKPVKL
ncbi:hypothetical protein FSP39_007795 [Pinctada imbricata]|uniref:G-protein coupled receptors family 1 profile domain-containing protein n=1 Tax=Pinctada imbricata TaxID=66713 RepID=A0AA89BUL4_PINIB|nr:hypothetical protein FSP39_007795 [Pinctada imbricata]